MVCGPGGCRVPRVSYERYVHGPGARRHDHLEQLPVVHLSDADLPDAHVHVLAAEQHLLATDVRVHTHVRGTCSADADSAVRPGSSVPRATAAECVLQEL